MAFKTPLLFIIFNRPEETRMVFDEIKKLRPEKLFIAADGPRADYPDDILKCKKTREIINEIDWPCETKTNFRDENLGCGKGPANAITWLFQHEEQGIILEDDCVPDKSFFFFCQELLEKYQDDSRVMHIAGTNHNPEFVRDNSYSYFFSQVGHMWGWATWKRAWSLYDIKMGVFDEIITKDYFKDIYPNPFIRKYMIKKFTETYTGKIKGVWDYQWEFTRIINSGLTIMPRNNLIHNIGFGDAATHTFSSNNYFKNASVKSLKFPLKHPPFVIKDVQSENKHFHKMFRWILKRKLFSTIGLNGYNSRG
jgi:hypothetical protein